ncbi:class A beta-lactamase [Synechococcus sp. ATX 2A4]|uniref:class A beta-lactamase n=1 Tax=Synechococcus sp. ATX 2A4 TaxID=2823727 RepID=UPI0037DA460F
MLNLAPAALAADTRPAGATVMAADPRQVAAVVAELAQLERSAGGRLGVFALDTATGLRIGHRSAERFPLCSTFKLLLAAAMLERSTRTPGLLEQRLPVTPADLVTYAPIAEQRVGSSMTIAELAAATVQYSDNAAANLLLRQLGGPAGMTAFARSIGNSRFRLDRWETELNSALPGDPRDTDTPAAMGTSVQALALGTALPAPQQQQLTTWLLGNTTGAARIRAGVPDGWQVGEKTGTCGAYGTANDVGVLFPPGRRPVVLAIFHTQPEATALVRNDVIAAATRLVVQAITAPSAPRPAARCLPGPDCRGK